MIIAENHTKLLIQNVNTKLVLLQIHWQILLLKVTKNNSIHLFIVRFIVSFVNELIILLINSILFLSLARQKLDINETIKVVLESDGTEIDENDYFDTLEKNTLIMILKPDEKWCSYSDIR